MGIVREQLNELLFQCLETEMGGVEIYTAAIENAVNEDLREEWTEYLEQTEHHLEVIRGAIEKLGLDPETETPGRLVVRHIGASLLEAMAMAREAGGSPEAAQLVAAECVVEAETKDHMNWSLLEKLVPQLDAKTAKVVKEAVEEVEDEEDEHLYHTKGWARELWLQSLGMPAVLPPREEKKHVKTAIGAARAEKARGPMARRSRS